MGSRNNKPGRIVKGTAKQPTLKDASGIWTLDEAMQAHRANAWPQPNLFQPVANSLRVKQQNTTSPGVLSKPIVREGDRRRFTMSMWVKLGTLAAAGGSIRTLWEGFTGTDNSYWLIYITSGNQLYIGRDDNGNPSGTTVTWAGVLRDPSAWYHLVFATDTLQATDVNKVKVWINGVQQTLGGTFPTQGYAVAMGRDRNNNSVTNGFGPGIRIASRWNLGFDQNFDGEYSEINFVDGYAIQPTLFGKLDTNNTWVPIAYTGSYGTNGFYLPFTNAATSQTLGYDASVNGTTAYDADQDPYRGSVALHLTGNGPAGGQNNTFADSGPNNHAVTRNGTVTQGSFSPFPMQANAPYNPATHGASMYQNDVGSDFPSFPTGSQGSNFTFAGDFTIEAWVYYTSASSGDTSLYVTSQDGSSYFAFNISMTAGNYNIYLNSGTTAIAHGITANTWTHVAMVRSGSTVTLYTNGVSKGTLTNSSTLGYSTMTINRCGGGVGGVSRYVSSFRIVKAAVYTSAFTPTMRPLGTLTNNLLNFSEDFTNSYWTAQSAVVGLTTNAAIAPDGTPSATLLVPSTSSAGQNIAGLHDSAAGVNTFSIYAKSAGYRYIQCFHSRSAGGDAGYVTFDLTTGTVTNSSVWSGSIVNVENGWYRIIATTSSLAGASANSNVRWAITDGTASRAPAFTGNGTSGIYVWGAQAELASSAGNYTPTPANFSTAPSLLLNFANAAVVDSTGANNITTVGSATITSASKYGSGALAFSGSTSNYFLTNPGSQFEPGSQDFTVEFWWYPISTGRQWFYHATTDYWFAVDYSSVSTNQKMGMWASSNGSSWNMINSDSGGNGICNTVVPQNQWNHIAYTRNNTTFRLFLNGKLDGIVSASGSIVDRSSQAKYIGTWAGAGGGAPAVNGSIDDFRFTKGVARYTSDFAPPARALPETGGKSFITQNINAGVVQRFTTVGSTSWTAPADVTQVEVLVVAGGGSGGSNNAGGGGGGGLIYNNQYPVTPGQTYTVTVGTGGISQAGSGGTNSGYQGTLSQFGNLVATPGSGGYGGNGQRGQESGSGSGGGGCRSVGPGAGFAGQGFAGGANRISAEGGGGGGAGGAGGSPNGGVGLQFGISGTPTYYAGGGGGGAETAGSVAGAGGLGGGGTGGAAAGATYTAGWSSGSGQAGTANTGGGGGAESQGNGAFVTGAGGSGIVIVRYTTTAVGNTSDSTTDNLTDSPTQYGHDLGAGGEVVGNYATFNPIYAQSATVTLSNGNLTASNPSTWVRALGTIAVNTGKWYFESTPSAGNWHMTGVEQPIYGTTHIGGSATKGIALVYDPSNTRGDISYNGGNSVYTGGSVTFNAGDIIGVALDLDNNNVKLYKNNVLQYNLSNLLQAGAYYTFGVSLYSGGTISGNFGQRAWAYAPPAGYNALTTKNLPRLTNAAAIAPNEYFDTVLYTGTGAARSVSGFNFAPDLLWVKDRSTSAFHRWFDRVRGATNSPGLYSNSTTTEAADNLTFTSNGFSYTTDPYNTGMNVNNNLHVVWGWRAGGAAVANTSGTITSQVSANTTSGFSIVSYTGTGVQATVGHGLSTAPSFIVIKSRTNATRNWAVYHSSFSAGEFMYLNLTSAKASDNSAWGPVTSTTFQLGNGVTPNTSWSESGNTFIAYCWTEVAGFSKIGTYSGNGSTDGPFVYCGFKPRWVMVKQATGTNAATGAWQIFDTARDTFNPCDFRLRANDAAAEGTGAPSFDIVSNGFKLRSTNANWNDSAGSATYIFMAFADKPFGNANGTAR